MKIIIIIVLVCLLFHNTGGYNIVASLQREAHPQVIGHAGIIIIIHFPIILFPITNPVTDTGASGYVPESSLIGYDLAANLLADYSEPDLILTKDSQFIASHDLTLEGTTNVASVYPSSRMETFVIEGKAITGFYAINFTLNEIRNLTIKQRFVGRSTLYNWMYPMPTIDEIIDWQIDHYNNSKRLVGIYPELKHPDFYNENGYQMEKLFLDKLKQKGYHTDINDLDTPSDLRAVVPVAIQCFKAESLKLLSTLTRIPLVQLIGTSEQLPKPSDVWNEYILDDIMKYAQAASPDKHIFTTDFNVSVTEAIRMRKMASDRNLQFVPWSFQLESQYIPKQFNNDPRLELQFFYGCLESNALFHEFPDFARAVKDECRKENDVDMGCYSQCPYLRVPIPERSSHI